MRLRDLNEDGGTTVGLGAAGAEWFGAARPGMAVMMR